jgi:four helix bundle protein
MIAPARCAPRHPANLKFKSPNLRSKFSVFRFQISDFRFPPPLHPPQLTMPTFQRFEDLPVWQESIRLAERCEDFVEAAKNQITWSKRDQLDRASLSVSNNIAEGFERGTTNELLAFLYIARGSAGEVRSMLCFFGASARAADIQISNCKFEIRCRELLPSTSRLGRLAPKLGYRRSTTPQ